MLTTRVPETWQDLQTQVAAILAQCGFQVAVEETIDLGRGQAEIDVYAQETIRGRRNLIICECKRWKSAVPQQVIHAFRTVTSEIGANMGYIIALNGFQAGAIEAVDRTNVRLVTWEEFQMGFEPTWLDAHFTPTLTEELDPLMSYTEPLAPAWFEALTEADQQAMVGLVRQHAALGVLVMRLSTYGRMAAGGNVPPLPIRGWAGEENLNALPDDVQDAQGYADLAAILLSRGRDAIAEFRVFRARAMANGAADRD